MEKLYISTESQRLTVATDRERYNLMGIHFNCKNVIATNGHYLVMRSKQEGEPSNQVIKLDKVKKKGLPQFHAVNGDYINEEGTKAQVLEPDCFPNVDAVLNTLPKNTIRVAINPRYLYEIAQCAGIEKDHMACVTLEIPLPDEGESSVSRGITFTAGEIAGVIMPMRTDAKPHETLEKMRS